MMAIVELGTAGIENFEFLQKTLKFVHVLKFYLSFYFPTVLN